MPRFMAPSTSARIFPGDRPQRRGHGIAAASSERRARLVQDVVRSPREIVISPPRRGTARNKDSVHSRRYFRAASESTQKLSRSVPVPSAGWPGPRIASHPGGTGFPAAFDQKIGSMQNAQIVIP